MEKSLCSQCEENLTCPLAYVHLQECLNRYKLPQGEESDRSTSVSDNP
jgi:hypothetical protein